MPLKQAALWFWQSASPEAQRARRIAKLALLILLFAGLFWVVPIQDVIRALVTADPLYMVLGMAFGFVSTLLTAVQMEPLTRNQGIRHNTWEILEINLAIKFYSLFSPTALVGSGIRWYRLAQPDGKVAESLAALAFFRMLEFFLTLAFGLSFFLLSGQQAIQVSLGWLVALILAIVATWVLITRYSVPMYGWFKRRAARYLESSYLKPIARRFEKFLVAVSAYANLPARDLLLSVFAGVASLLSGVASGIYLARAVGIDIPFLDMGWIQATILYATSLPFAFAGGLGIREVTVVALLSLFGTSPDLALAFSLLLFARGVLISLVGGALEGIRFLRSESTQPLNGVQPPGGKQEGP